MDKRYKVALAILYLLQVVVVFREPIAHAFGMAKHAWEPSTHGDQAMAPPNAAETALASRANPSAWHAFWQRLTRREEQPAYALQIPPHRQGEMAAAIGKSEHEKEHHPIEHKALPKKNKKHSPISFLILNLFPLFKKKRRPGAAIERCQDASFLQMLYPAARG